MKLIPIQFVHDGRKFVLDWDWNAGAVVRPVGSEFAQPLDCLSKGLQDAADLAALKETGGLARNLVP